MKFIDIKTINFHLLFFVYQRIINFPKLPNTSKTKANTHQSFKIYLNFISMYLNDRTAYPRLSIHFQNHNPHKPSTEAYIVKRGYTRTNFILNLNERRKPHSTLSIHVNV